ncbi:MAG: hypothetical protein U0Y82_04770 [Thermoleophilia bacterium]
MNTYQVTVRRQGTSPLTLTMLVGAHTHDAAAAYAAALAERRSGGMFEAGRVRRAWFAPSALDGVAA